MQHAPDCSVAPLEINHHYSAAANENTTTVVQTVVLGRMVPRKRVCSNLDPTSLADRIEEQVTTAIEDLRIYRAKAFHKLRGRDRALCTKSSNR